MKGFLGTYAGFSADLNFLSQITMGVALLSGSWLARLKRYRAHGVCQAAVLILNLFPIFFVMWPSFDRQVLPHLSRRISKPYYAVAAVHGVLGVLAELLGVYILLVAGTNLLPPSWRFDRWKLWMRIELALWWVALATGTVTYLIWYLPRARQ